jgi:hypothetical protein
MNKYLVIDSRPFGLFSIFLHTIDCLKWCEENGYLPYVRWSRGRYDTNLYREGAKLSLRLNDPKLIIDKENFVNDKNLINNSGVCLYSDNESDNPWEYYFEPINKIPQHHLNNKNFHISDIFMYGQLDFDLSNKFLIRNLHSYDGLKLWSLQDEELIKNHRKEINNFIIKNIVIKEHILKKINSFYTNKMSNFDLLIGVHIRGTDKKTEFPFKQLTIDSYIDKIKDIINKNNNKKYKIYVASDNNESIIKVANTFGKENICSYPCFRMKEYNSNMPIHLTNNTNKRKHGEETLIEMLLLSKCDVIIGTDSNLTATSAYFNPEAHLVYMNRIDGV